MTTLTLNIPDTLVAQAKAIGVYDEHHIVQAFSDFIKTQKIQSDKRELGGAEGLVTYIAEDFDAPLDDFKDYM